MTTTKRDCPALGAQITSLRCGQERGSRLACPPTCPSNPFNTHNRDLLMKIEKRVLQKIRLRYALEAAEILAKEGISAEVIDLRTIRPLDKATVLASLAKTNRLVVAEEGWPTCSVGSEILAICMEEGFDDLDAPVLRITNEDVPMPYAANLEKAMLVNADKIVAGVRRTLGV